MLTARFFFRIILSFVDKIIIRKANTFKFRISRYTYRLAFEYNHRTIIMIWWEMLTWDLDK